MVGQEQVDLATSESRRVREVADTSNESEFVYTRAEARQKAKMGIDAFDEALRRGDFLSIRIGRRVLIPREAFERKLKGEV